MFLICKEVRAAAVLVFYLNQNAIGQVWQLRDFQLAKQAGSGGVDSQLVRPP